MHRNKAGNITIVSGGPIKKLIAVVLLLDSGRIVGVLGVGYGSTQSTPNQIGDPGHWHGNGVRPLPTQKFAKAADRCTAAISEFF
jgi:hypothetical protein